MLSDEFAQLNLAFLICIFMSTRAFTSSVVRPETYRDMDTLRVLSLVVVVVVTLGVVVPGSWGQEQQQHKVVPLDELLARGTNSLDSLAFCELNIIWLIILFMKSVLFNCSKFLCHDFALLKCSTAHGSLEAASERQKQCCHRLLRHGQTYA